MSNLSTYNVIDSLYENSKVSFIPLNNMILHHIKKNTQHHITDMEATDYGVNFYNNEGYKVAMYDNESSVYFYNKNQQLHGDTLDITTLKNKYYKRIKLNLNHFLKNDIGFNTITSYMVDGNDAWYYDIEDNIVAYFDHTNSTAMIYKENI
jgi:hypothetical protein